MKATSQRPLEIRIEAVDGGSPCLLLAGEGEQADAPRLSETLRALLDGGKPYLVLDTRDLTFLHPDCCEVLEAAAGRLAAAGGRLVLVDNSLPVERALKLPCLDQRALVVSTLRQAAAYLSSLH